LSFPELARGMTPLDGILVPTLGAFYLGTTLLFPFVAIRALGQDKESGALKLVPAMACVDRQRWWR
jgi:ABC-2 type transport system permease protein